MKNSRSALLLWGTLFVLFTALTPDREALKDAADYLTAHPQTADNYNQRLAYLRLIDAASAECPSTLYFDYLKGKPVDFTQKEGRILGYLDRAVDRILSALAKGAAKEDENVYLWHVYNMGYLLQYKNELLGIDLTCRDAARFAPFLEALLNTHPHADHYSTELIAKMEELKKPFVSNWYANRSKTSGEKSFRFGSFRVRTSVGDHHYWSGNRDDMLMFEIRIKGRKIFHSGDNSNIGKMKGLRDVDVYIGHHEVGFAWNDAVTVIQPKIDIISHIQELGHSIQSGWRWTYAHADEKNQKRGSYPKGLLLSWGERIKL